MRNNECLYFKCSDRQYQTDEPDFELYLKATPDFAIFLIASRRNFDFCHEPRNLHSQVCFVTSLHTERYITNPHIMILCSILVDMRKYVVLPAFTSDQPS
jgi:hypothetical protein